MSGGRQAGSAFLSTETQDLSGEQRDRGRRSSPKNGSYCPYGQKFRLESTKYYCPRPVKNPVPSTDERKVDQSTAKGNPPEEHRGTNNRTKISPPPDISEWWWRTGDEETEQVDNTF
jgi:hypothetical protein